MGASSYFIPHWNVASPEKTVPSATVPRSYPRSRKAATAPERQAGVGVNDHVGDAQVVEKPHGLVRKLPLEALLVNASAGGNGDGAEGLPASVRAQAPLGLPGRRKDAQLRGILHQTGTRGPLLGGLGQKAHHGQGVIGPAAARAGERQRQRTAGKRMSVLAAARAQSASPALAESESPQKTSGATPAARHAANA